MVPRAQFEEMSNRSCKPGNRDSNSPATQQEQHTTSYNIADILPDNNPGNNPGNSLTSGNTVTTNKRPYDETNLATQRNDSNTFEDQYRQRRLRRRLARQQDVANAGGEQQDPCVASSNRDVVATAAKWKGIHESRKSLKQQPGNKV